MKCNGKLVVSIAGLTISDSVGKVGVFQPDGNKSVENFARNHRELWWFSVIECLVPVDNDKTSNVREREMGVSYSSAAQSEQSTEQPATRKHYEEGDYRV